MGGRRVDWLTVINTSVGLMSIFLGGFAIWLSLHLYTRSKDSETATAKTLEAIKAQSEALQRLTGRWMDRFTRHATEPRPADEGLMQLVSVVASLPTTILTNLHVIRNQSDSVTNQALLRDAVDGYIAIYYYSAQTNVLAQGFLPSEDVFDSNETMHTGTQAIIDKSAHDFFYIANLLERLDQNLVRSSQLTHLLDEAINNWRPLVRDSSQVFEARRQA
jgi:hypothetical protein